MATVRNYDKYFPISGNIKNGNGDHINAMNIRISYNLGGYNL